MKLIYTYVYMYSILTYVHMYSIYTYVWVSFNIHICRWLTWALFGIPQRFLTLWLGCLPLRRRMSWSCPNQCRRPLLVLWKLIGFGTKRVVILVLTSTWYPFSKIQSLEYVCGVRECTNLTIWNGISLLYWENQNKSQFNKWTKGRAPIGQFRWHVSGWPITTLHSPQPHQYYARRRKISSFTRDDARSFQTGQNSIKD